MKKKEIQFAARLGRITHNIIYVRVENEVRTNE